MVVWTDGSARRRSAGAGVVIKNNEYEDILRMSVPLGPANSMTAEAAALLIGIDAAVALSTERIKVKSDFRPLVSLVTRKKYRESRCRAYDDLVRRIREVISNHDVCVHWIPRKSNTQADEQARLASAN